MNKTPARAVLTSVGQPRHQLLRAVFDEALRQNTTARGAYLLDACASHPTLGPEVMRLIALHNQARTFLEHPPDPLSVLDAEEQFSGTDRFEVLRRIGAGGMGVVYDVRDHVRQENVALKTLVRTSAADVYRLKREFRSLADVAHPNLACLYELFVEDAHCFFTMELVAGVTFVDYVRGAAGDGFSPARLLHVLPQLVEGVSALHRKGKLHRDLKPSNILVTPEGRVVILDFGLIAELRPHGGDVHYVRGGTPAYMSPEESAGLRPSEASDWYGVGITLYEALTGVVPFAGPIIVASRLRIRRAPRRSCRRCLRNSARCAWVFCIAIRTSACQAPRRCDDRHRLRATRLWSGVNVSSQP
jgi:predicted Ser/Thr protein kinase